ncbi:glutathione synthase/RimK-type ligase-like ATP-grasp enzyme [Paenibacillus cellulosilyticus]|uniref:Glutathione synthase/RimK-type ligase-like ATP-grasp enzyme n=1 Tax=Paenibacillus cellulosilyticus TaxID=375489 RepID=A0A2V2YEF7_9BACL|nr:YheC/YheD family protein [Paenibacillus cellulosilyticus]PWV90569.1 glutathione synthase/RimK-type ligase-like ATP-grasp enzyme [Paenibacillus cellulosilyticus]QKS46774.1 YheC/YheD family protein [Paenibacillus cellulosilyticus]
MAKPVLGILTLYLNDSGALEERPIYQRMTTAAKKLGLDVFVFTPRDVNYKTNRINAQFYDSETKKWSKRWTSFPNMIYDRCRIQKSSRFDELRRFRQQYGHLTFLNRPLRNKMTVHRTLSRDKRFSSNLPSSRMYESIADLNAMLRKHSLIYLKPINGTGGRGILRIERIDNDKVLLQGRDQQRRIVEPQRIAISELSSKLSSWSLKEKRYLVQQGIPIKLPNGRVHDYRMLVQKDGEGVWRVTGCAGRIGAQNSVTSNLHGGGHAATMDTLLKRWIKNESKIDSVKNDAEQFGVQVAQYLEQSFGRLCELALDLAIDKQGRVWLLEVNPKPAREVFIEAGDNKTYQRAITRPLEYALHLYETEKKKKTEVKTSSLEDELRWYD